jgi:hypothetical protein
MIIKKMFKIIIFPIFINLLRHYMFSLITILIMGKDFKIKAIIQVYQKML